MCGIVGVIRHGEPLTAEMLTAMRDAVAHRGPDDRGVWLSDDGRVGLAHRRLAVIDLSPAGRQPLSDAEGKVWLVFNGEVYNFRALRCQLEQLGYGFWTNTDTEVILHAYKQWGEACVQRLNGMFAVAIYDSARGTLFLARDRLGKKPLYYLESREQFAFGSEAKCFLPLRAGRWSLEPRAVNAFFAFGYVPGELSMFEGVKKLLPGHSLTYDAMTGEVKVRAYWTPPLAQPGDHANQDIGTLLDELEELFRDSVRLRLNADVPVGVLLSGGVDSSLVTAMAAQASGGGIQTFTVGFPGGAEFDERPHALQVAEYFGTTHHELLLPSCSLDTVRTIAAQLDEPLGDPSIVPTYLVSQLTRQHVTVALGGDGGDELFGGYGWYRAGLRAERLFGAVPRFARRAVAGAAKVLPVGLRGRNYLRSLGDDLCHLMTTNSSVFDLDMRRSLFLPEMASAAGRLGEPERYKRGFWPATADSVGQMSMLDLRTFLPDDILFKVDRASMAFALEMRAPWLDYRIVEFALTRVPSPLKVTLTDSRRLQRQLAARVLPPALDLNRKQGFVMPINQWMAGAWGDHTLDVLAATAAKEWLDLGLVGRLLAGQRRGRTNGVRLFACLMFGLWLEGLGRVSLGHE